ncbi:acyl-CoA dehydrogenase family protein [Streptomyces sp. NPDC000151]|uniref:acyl-CoA dehydrogenase family protein n=1 Tax=Streptomyces sp. NPDC000151 TaxID=3154244 RepID=UPI003319B148
MPTDCGRFPGEFGDPSGVLDRRVYGTPASPEKSTKPSSLSKRSVPDEGGELFLCRILTDVRETTYVPSRRRQEAPNLGSPSDGPAHLCGGRGVAREQRDATKAKRRTTEPQQRTIPRCLQPRGWCGYLREHPTIRAFTDAHIRTICGGTTRITKDRIGRAPVR